MLSVTAYLYVMYVDIVRYTGRLRRILGSESICIAANITEATMMKTFLLLINRDGTNLNRNSSYIGANRIPQTLMNISLFVIASWIDLSLSGIKPNRCSQIKLKIPIANITGTKFTISIATVLNLCFTLYNIIKFKI